MLTTPFVYLDPPIFTNVLALFICQVNALMGVFVSDVRRVSRDDIAVLISCVWIVCAHASSIVVYSCSCTHIGPGRCRERQ